MSEPLIKHVGVDHHARKVLTGKFSSNVQPARFGRDAQNREPWGGPCCDWSNREYLTKCTICGLRREEARERYGPRPSDESGTA
jgi:hypothetical protein